MGQQEPSRERELLSRAVHTIKQLRHQNEIQSARLKMFDDMMLVFNTEPPRTGLHGAPDLVWEIERHLERIETKPEPPNGESIPNQ